MQIKENHINELLIKQDFALAFDEIVDAYTERLYFVIRNIVQVHEDADDVLQEVFVKVWKNLNTFSGKSTLYTWLYRIATNESLNHLRKSKHKLVDQEQTKVIHDRLIADPYFVGNEAQLTLQQAISVLPEKQRTVFIMRYFDEMKYEEISEMLEVTSATLRTNYHLAVKKIEEFIKQKSA